MSHSSNHTVSTAITPESIAAALASSKESPDIAVATYALGLGDDALLMAQRLGEWIAHAPELEEDVALGNIGLDQLGHARSFLTYAGSAFGKSEDELAYFRDEPEFLNRQLFEQPNGDFAQTIAKQLIASVYFAALYRGLAASADAMIAAIAAKALKEVDYHLDHCVQWVTRLGLGTAESNRRMQRGLDAMWAFADELFRSDALTDALVARAIAVDPATLRPAFDARVPPLILASGLAVPVTGAARGGGRDGFHTESFGPLLAEMQVLARANPGASW